MKENIKALFTGQSGVPLGFGVAATGFPLLAILLAMLGDSIDSEHMALVSTFFFIPLTTIMGLVLGIIAIRSARRLRAAGVEDARLRLSEVFGAIGIVLLPIYLLLINL